MSYLAAMRHCPTSTHAYKPHSLFPEVDHAREDGQSGLMEEPTVDLTESNIIQDALNNV